jgi:hypothetical protein
MQRLEFALQFVYQNVLRRHVSWNDWKNLAIPMAQINTSAAKRVSRQNFWPVANGSISPPGRPCGSLSQLTACGAVLRGNIFPPVRMPGSMSAIVAGYRFRRATKHLVSKLTLLIRCQMRGLGQGFEKISICRVVRRNQNARIQQIIDKDAIGFHQ